MSSALKKQFFQFFIFFISACSFLGQVILDMTSKAFDADDFNKPFKSLIRMRKVCVETNPSVFNDWIRKFKEDLPVEKIKFWELTVKGKLLAFFWEIHFHIFKLF